MLDNLANLILHIDIRGTKHFHEDVMPLRAEDRIMTEVPHLAELGVNKQGRHFGVTEGK